MLQHSFSLLSWPSLHPPSTFVLRPHPNQSTFPMLVEVTFPSTKEYLYVFQLAEINDPFYSSFRFLYKSNFAWEVFPDVPANVTCTRAFSFVIPVRVRIIHYLCDYFINSCLPPVEHMLLEGRSHVCFCLLYSQSLLQYLPHRRHLSFVEECMNK